MKHVGTLTIDHEFASLVQDLLDNTSSVIYVKDAEFHYLLINRQFEALFHLSRDEIFGKTDYDIFPTELADAFRNNDRRVLETGEFLQCEEVAPHDDGPHHYFSLKFPLRDARGLIYAMAGISTDITERIHAKREIASLQYRHRLILDSIAEGICGLDSNGRIDFLNPAAERMLLWTTDELRGSNYTKIVVSKAPNGQLHHSTLTCPMFEVLNGQEAAQVQGATFRRRDGSLLPVEYNVAPIRDGVATIGAVVAFRDMTDRILQIATEQEIQTARRIQQSLYPRNPPQFPGFDFAAMSWPCTKACGDYFDFIPWGENRLGIALGDVSGHGLGPALEMVATRAVLRTAILTETSPVGCLSRLNQILVEDLPDEMFVSLFLAALNTADRTLTYAAAGHDAMILRADGDLERIESTGPVLGMNRSAKFLEGRTLSLNSGDILLICTDGVGESMSPARELFGRQRISHLLCAYRRASAQEILNAIHDAAETFRGREPQRDDITGVVVKVL